MTKQASSEPKAGLTDRITRAQSSKSSRPLEGSSKRRRTCASSSLEQQGSKVASARTLRSSAPEQPVPTPPPRRRWFLDCVEIPPYPHVVRRVPHRPTLEKPPQSERTEKRRPTRSAQGASSPPLKRLRRSKRGRAERSPSVEEAEEAESKVGGQFDWWYESSLSPLTDIGSRPPSPVEVAVEAVSEVGVVLEGREEELGLSEGGIALTPQGTVDGMAAGEKDLPANPSIDGPPQHAMDPPENREISSLFSIPAEEGYLSDDGCPTEAQRGSPVCEAPEGEPASSPAVTSINSPEVIAEPLAPPRLEVTPVNEVALAKPLSIEKEPKGLATSDTNISLEGVAAHEAYQPISPIPDMATHSVHPTLPPPTAASLLYNQTPVNSTLRDNGLYSAIPEAFVPAGCEFGSYSTPDPSSGWTTPYPLHPCDTGTSDHTRVENLFSTLPNQQNPFNMQPSAPPPLAVSFVPHTGAAQFFVPSDPSMSRYNSQPTFFGSHEFGRTQPPMTTSQPNPEYLSSITPHFTPPPSTIAFAPVIPHDWLPNQPPPHPAALPEIAARVMLQQEEPATRPPSPPHNPQPTARKGKGKYARKTMKTEHYEFSSFSYYPLGHSPPPTSEPVASSSTPTITEPILRSESLITPPNPPSTASTYTQDPQGRSINVEAANVSAPVFSSFVNLTPASFVPSGEGAQPFISSSKYRPTGVRWM